MNILSRLVWLPLLLLLAPAVVWADLMGTYSLAEGNAMTIEFRDRNTFRINIGADSYILMNTGKAYIVSKRDSEWEAISVESLKAMMDRMGFGAHMQKAVEKSSPPRFEDTGRTERIAGISGKVYTLTRQRPDGGIETAEVVMGQDDRLLQLQQANIRLAEVWGNTMNRRGPGASFGDVLKKYQKGSPEGGLLRYAEDLRLVSIQETELAGSRFSVPNLASLDIPAGMAQQPPSPAPPVATAPPSQPEQPGRISRGAERIGDSAAEEAETTVNENVREGVRKGVDSFMRGLFGN